MLKIYVIYTDAKAENISWMTSLRILIITRTFYVVDLITGSKIHGTLMHFCMTDFECRKERDRKGPIVWKKIQLFFYILTLELLKWYYFDTHIFLLINVNHNNTIYGVENASLFFRQEHGTPQVSYENLGPK